MPFADTLGAERLASQYFLTRLGAVRRAQQLSASEQFDLARSPLSDDELEDVIDSFRDTPAERTGWGLAEGLNEILSREPKRIPVSDIKALQKNLISQGYLPPDTVANGVWDPTMYAGFRRWDRDNMEAQRQGRHWYSAPITSGVNALTNTLPSRVFQGIVGAAKGLVLQTPETLERAGAAGGGIIGAAIGTAVLPGAGTLIGGAIGAAGGFLFDLFGEEEGEDPGIGLDDFVDALSPWTEYQDNPKGVFEDLGYTLTAASFVTGIGTAAKGVAGGVRALQAARALPEAGAVLDTSAVGAALTGAPTELASVSGGGATLAARAPIIKAALYRSPVNNQLGVFGTITRAAARKAGFKAGSLASLEQTMLKYSGFAFGQRLGPNIALKAFAGTSQAAMGARLFGGLGQGSRERTEEAKAALEAELGRELDLKEVRELEAKTAQTAIEKSITSAPELKTGIELPFLGDIVDLAAFVLYPEKLLPFGGPAISKAAVNVMGDTMLAPFAHAVQHQMPDLGISKAVSQVKAWLKPTDNAWLRADYGIDREAHGIIARAYRNAEQAFRKNALANARADIIRDIRKEYEVAGESETLNRIMRFSMDTVDGLDGPTDFTAWLVKLNGKHRGLDRLAAWKEANVLARKVERELENSKTLRDRAFSISDEGQFIRAQRPATGRVTTEGPGTNVDRMVLKDRIAHSETLAQRYDRLAQRGTQDPFTSIAARERARLARSEAVTLKKQLDAIESASSTKVVDRLVITPARTEFVDRSLLFAKRREFLEMRQTVIGAVESGNVNAEVIARQKLANFVDELASDGLIPDSLVAKAKTGKPSDRIAKVLEEQAKAAAKPIELDPAHMARFEELGYKPVSTGDDVLFPDQLEQMIEVGGIGDYTRRAQVWETLGLSPKWRTDRALFHLRREHEVAELNQVFAETGVKLSGEQALRRLHDKLREINHDGAVLGPFTKPKEGRLRLYKVDVRDLSMPDVLRAFEDVPGINDEVAHKIFGALRRGAAYGGELKLMRPMESMKALGGAMRLNGLPGFSDLVRTWHADVPGRISRGALRREQFNYRPAGELARSPERSRVEVALKGVAEKSQVSEGQRQFGMMMMDSLAESQVRAGRFASVDDAYRVLDVSYAERYLKSSGVDQAEQLTRILRGVDDPLARIQLEEDVVQGLTQFGPDFGTVMQFFRQADFQTLVHENAHLLRRMLSPEDLATLERSYGLRKAPEVGGIAETAAVISTRTKSFRDSTQAMLRRSHEEGGFTWDPHTGAFRQTGVPGAGTAVATGDETAKLIGPGEAAFNDVDAFRAEVRKFMGEHTEELKNSRMHVGGWKDNEGIHLDVSEILVSRTEAQRVGALRKQKAVFDLETFEDLPATVWTRGAEERFAKDAENFIMQRVVPGHSRGAFDVLRHAVGSMWRETRPYWAETNLVPRDVRRIFDKQFEDILKTIPERRSVAALKAVGSKQAIGGAVAGGALGAVEGEDFEDILKGVALGAATGLATRGALRRTYGYLPDYLTRLNTALRYTLSFTFDAGRYSEQNLIAMTKHGLPPMLSPTKYIRAREWRTPFVTGTVRGDDAWNHAVRFFDELNGTTWFQNIDDLDRRLFQAGMLGFSPRNWEIAQAFQLYQRGMGAEKIREAVSQIGRYGLGRTAAEKSANFLVFPFSFSKKLIGTLGDFFLQAPARSLILHESYRRYHESEFDEKVQDFLDRHVPLLEQLKQINNLAYGISPGRFFLQGLSDQRSNVGKAMQIMASFFVPSGAATPLAQAAGGAGDLVAHAFSPIVLTGESITRGGGMDPVTEIFRRYIPFVRELDQYFLADDAAVREQLVALKEGAAPYYQFQKYQDELRESKAGYEGLSMALGYQSLDGLLQSDAGLGVQADLEAKRNELASKYPTGFAMSQTFENSDAIDERAMLDLAERVSQGRAAPAEEHILELAEDQRRFETLKQILSLPPEFVDAMAAKSIRDKAVAYASDRRFGELYDRFFAYTYGPIRRVA